ncbi:MAG: hypothetical protein U0838_11035 [Chloroflexota bacterium]
MDLIAGDQRDIVLALAVGDMAGLDDPDRFTAHLSLGGGLDPTWLDAFSEAVRTRPTGPGDQLPRRLRRARRRRGPHRAHRGAGGPALGRRWPK